MRKTAQSAGLTAFKLAACLMALIAITGCGPATYTETTGKYKLPPELSDCKVYNMGGGGAANDITVVRCPALATTTTSYSVQSGKTRTTRTIAEVE